MAAPSDAGAGMRRRRMAKMLRTDHSRHDRRLTRLVVASHFLLLAYLAIAALTSSAGASAVSARPDLSSLVAKRASVPDPRLFPKYDGRSDLDVARPAARHGGDHDEEDEAEPSHAAEATHGEAEDAHMDMSASGVTTSHAPPAATASMAALHDHEAGGADAGSHSSMSHTHDEHNHEHGHQEGHGHGHGHGHGDQEHSHAHASHPYDGVPDAAVAGDLFVAVPPLPAGAGGHTHSHGNQAPAEELNETTIVRGKGPDPLSYIEWDFAYGIGKPHELKRLANAYRDNYHNVMGVAGGRWRTLVDERDNSTRKDVVSDIQNRARADAQNPGRHPFLMALHVVGCIISCFILLPAALALRAASSNLAPVASLAYLMMLAGSLAASWLYKAMTPQLYPKHAHSGLGYTIFWISLVVLGGDVFHLLGQLWHVVRSNKGASGGQQLSAVYRALVRSEPSSPPLPRSNAPYDAEEEEHMLSIDGSSGASDAHELDMGRADAGSSRQGSSASSTSPARSVHFEDEEGHEHGHEHGDEERRQHMEMGAAHNEILVSTWRAMARGWSGDQGQPMSPTSTLCNTPQNSLLSEHSARDRQHSNAPWKQHPEHHAHERFARKPRKSRGEKKAHPLAILKSILRYTHVTVARSLPVLSFAAAYTGLAVYTGSCRGPYKNVCLAHGIKGGVFFWYGLLTFGRYMGAYADMGWAWNRRPARKGSNGEMGSSAGVSAEWIECLVILIYGSTNTWMERFSAKAGDPYTVKQVQHISIAVMFWFAGLLGLVLETKSLKSLLAIPVVLKQDYGSRSARAQRRANGRADAMSERDPSGLTANELVAGVTAPPSYSFSFNPFPALVIGVTGVAMAAHHQDYVYEVSIHSLWGNLLAGFSVLRMLTYCFLWLRPPTSSIMPSRPPTEALASFSLACGGFVFMLSSEEVSFVAMRNGFGDFMMILNVTVALVSLLFCWVAGLMVLKAWAVRREHRRDAKYASPISLKGALGWHAQHRSQISRTTTDASPHHQQQQHTTAAQDSVFVLEDEDEYGHRQDVKRHLSSSPEQA